MYTRILRLAIPNIISNVTVPLLSIVDIALAGRMGTVEAIGAVSVAGGLVSFVYWLFAFLRMGTTGFVAQAYGRTDVRDITTQWVRGLGLAIGLSFVIILARPWVYEAGFLLSAQTMEVSAQARAYIEIALLGAPAALCLYVLNGWYIGMQNTRIPMWIALWTNVLNIGISIYLVGYHGMGVRGLAIGTVASQYIAVAALMVIATSRYGRILQFVRLSDLTRREGAGAYLSVGIQLFVRTAMLGSVTLFFTYASASIGALTLAANALLMQLFTLFSYFLDGFAYAGEALTGRYVGERNGGLLGQMWRSLFRIGWGFALLASTLYFFFPEPLIGLLTDESVVVSHAAQVAPWVALIPITGFGAFLWDGIFVGATAARLMLEAMLLATVIFFVTYFICIESLGVHGLWLAFNLYLLSRSLYCTLRASSLCITARRANQSQTHLPPLH